MSSKYFGKPFSFNTKSNPDVALPQLLTDLKLEKKDNSLEVSFAKIKNLSNTSDLKGIRLVGPVDSKDKLKTNIFPRQEKKWQEIAFNEKIFENGQLESNGVLFKSLPNKTYFTIGKYQGSKLLWQKSDTDLILAPECVFHYTRAFDSPEPTNFNSQRVSQGNNNYRLAVLLQWLNSSKKVTFFSPTHPYDAITEEENVGGFLSEWSDNEIAFLREAERGTAINADGDALNKIRAKVHLLSTTNVGFSGNTNVTGAICRIFSDNESRKLSNNGAYWLRDSVSGNFSQVQIVNGDGTLGTAPASQKLYCRPIIQVPSECLVSATEETVEGKQCRSFLLPETRVRFTVDTIPNEIAYYAQYTYNSQRRFQNLEDGIFKFYNGTGGSSN